MDFRKHSSWRQGVVATAALSCCLLFTACASGQPEGAVSASSQSPSVTPIAEPTVPPTREPTIQMTPSGPSPIAAEPDPEPTSPESEPPVPGAYIGGGGPIPDMAQPARYETSTYGGERYTAIATPPEADSASTISCEVWEASETLDAGALCFVPSYGDKYGSEGKWFLNTVGFDVNGLAEVTGSGGSVYGMYPPNIINNGEILYFDNFVCANELDNLTCWNADTGHGAFITGEYFDSF